MKTGKSAHPTTHTIACGYAFAERNASAYRTPQVGPRYAEILSLERIVPSGLSGSNGSLRTSAISLPSHAIACGHSSLAFTNVFGPGVAWQEPRRHGEFAGR